MYKKLRFVLMIIIISFPLTAAADEYINTYQGSGDDYIQIKKTIDDFPAAALILGNSAGRHFAVTSYSSTGEYIDLLVNTTDSYKGTVPIDLGSNKTAKFLEINAVGAWSIHIYPIIAIPHVTSEAVFSGTGDSLLWIDGTGSMLSIKGNSSERHFCVTAYDSYGSYNGLLVNTTNRYSGRVRLPKDSLILQIGATGDWSVELL
ncbi:MAG: hypothetical protein WC239_07120 [Sphaerochaetaceae bacterium]